MAFQRNPAGKTTTTTTTTTATATATATAIATKATPATGTMDDGTPAAASDLVDRMRRLSVTSHTSSFSIVSAASSSPSVQSLDSHGSIAGGIQVAQSTEQSIVIVKPGKKRRRAAAAAATPSSAAVATTPGDEPISEPSPNPATTSIASTCPFWYQFDGFAPSPTAKFKHEFARLAKSQGWGSSQKRKRQLEALRAEVAFHHGTCTHKLVQWQKLCEEMSVETNLPSIVQCKKALKKVYINLWDVVDHRRNPELPITHFKSHAKFYRAICGSNTFPREIAKEDGFINVLLRTV